MNQVSEPSGDLRYVVMVDDNFHPYDEGETCVAGENLSGKKRVVFTREFYANQGNECPAPTSLAA